MRLNAMQCSGNVLYSLGCNFDPDLIRSVSELNESATHGRINEFYGSTREDASLSARPAYRLPVVSRYELEAYISACLDVGVIFNYTLNTPHLGAKRELIARSREIASTVKFLIGAGVGRFTVTSPLMAEIVREASDEIPLEVSTIAHIDTVTQIKFWRDRYKICGVCGSILKNRNIRFLMSAADYCRRAGITYKAIVNEFCGVGGPGAYGTHCIYRDSCYLCHAENLTDDEDALFGRYPMDRCTSSRIGPETWLKMNFIRPEDIQRYSNIGVKAFKITGRTGTTEHLLRTANAYLQGHWRGNLLSLWKHLETIPPGRSEAGFIPNVTIDNTSLNDFVSPWFTDPDKDCANEVCGETCTYCDNFLERTKRGQPCNG